MNFQEIIDKNRRKTALVLLTYIAIFIFIGILVDVVRINADDFGRAVFELATLQIFPTVTFVMFIVAGGMILFSISGFQKIMLSGSQYKEIDPKRALSTKEREIYDSLKSLIEASKMPFTPKIFIMDAPYMNAFASGWSEKNSMIALTTALIEKLTKGELKAYTDK